MRVTKKSKKSPMRKKLPSIKGLKKKAWDLCSKCIRLENSKGGFCTCYTCGERLAIKDAQAGHGISGRGAFILFEERVIKPQCRRCNIFLGGNYQSFVPRLIREIGIKEYEELERLSHTPIKRDRSYYENLIENFSNRIGKLEKNHEGYSSRRYIHTAYEVLQATGKGIKDGTIRRDELREAKGLVKELSGLIGNKKGAG